MRAVSAYLGTYKTHALACALAENRRELDALAYFKDTHIRDTTRPVRALLHKDTHAETHAERTPERTSSSRRLSASARDHVALAPA